MALWSLQNKEEFDRRLLMWARQIPGIVQGYLDVPKEYKGSFHTPILFFVGRGC